MRKTGQRGKRGDFPAPAVLCGPPSEPCSSSLYSGKHSQAGGWGTCLSLLEILHRFAQKIQTSSLNFVPYPDMTDCLGLAKWFTVFTCPCGDPVDRGLLSEASSYCISRMDAAWHGSLIGARPAWV